MPMINDHFYREIRCKNDSCRKLLGYEYVFAGRIAFFCPRCSELTEMSLKHMQNTQNTATIKSEFSIGNSTEAQKKGGE